MVTGDPGVLGAHVTQSMKIVSYIFLKWLRGLFWDELESIRKLRDAPKWGCFDCQALVPNSQIPKLNTKWNQQALQNSCELLRQRRELHASSWNCMQAYVTACKLMYLHAFWNILEHTAWIMEHSETFCMHSETFWNFLHAYWNILELYCLHTVKEFQLGTRTDTQTDGQKTLGLVELRLRS